MTTETLTSKQQAILAFIQSYVAAHGFSPSVRDIQYGVGISAPSLTNYHVSSLERLGYIARERRMGRVVTRSITLIARDF